MMGRSLGRRLQKAEGAGDVARLAADAGAFARQHIVNAFRAEAVAARPIADAFAGQRLLGPGNLGRIEHQPKPAKGERAGLRFRVG